MHDVKQRPKKIIGKIKLNVNIPLLTHLSDKRRVNRQGVVV